MSQGFTLERLMPVWIPGKLLIGYVTAVILFVGGLGILLAKNTRMAATYLGTWLVLVVLFVYGPILDFALHCQIRTQASGLTGSTTSRTRCYLPDRKRL